MNKEKFSTKTVLVLLEDLQVWQKLNVSAFLASAVAHKYPETMGPDFVDASNVKYMAIFRQPVMVFGTNAGKLRKVYKLARERNLDIGIYTKLIFTTQGDDNLKAVVSLNEEGQDLVGICIYGKVELVNECTKDISLHK